MHILSEIDMASVIFLIVMIKAICVCGCVCVWGGGGGCMSFCVLVCNYENIKFLSE